MTVENIHSTLMVGEASSTGMVHEDLKPTTLTLVETSCWGMVLEDLKFWRTLESEDLNLVVVETTHGRTEFDLKPSSDTEKTHWAQRDPELLVALAVVDISHRRVVLENLEPLATMVIWVLEPLAALVLEALKPSAVRMVVETSLKPSGALVAV